MSMNLIRALAGLLLVGAMTAPGNAGPRERVVLPSRQAGSARPQSAVANEVPSVEVSDESANEDAAEIEVPINDPALNPSTVLWHAGRWWYQMPGNRWVVWQNNRWQATGAPTFSERTVNDPDAALPEGTPPAPPSRTMHAPSARRSGAVRPLPRSWYFSGNVYTGPYYYYDEFYKPYGGMRPHLDYPVPQPPRRPGQVRARW